MPKFLLSFFLSVSLLLAFPLEGRATVGLVTAPALIAVGGVVAATGGIGFIDGTLEGPLCRIKKFDGVLSCVIFAVSGLVVAALGLVILDGEKSLAFSRMDLSMPHLSGVTEEELSVYHDELDQLNFIAREITEEASKTTDFDARSRWLELGNLLSPASLKLAGLSGEAFLRRFRAQTL